MKQKKVEIGSNCGRVGRQARTRLRDQIKGGGGLSQRDLSHLQTCGSCLTKIEQAIANNPRTTYLEAGKNAREVIRVVGVIVENRRRFTW